MSQPVDYERVEHIVSDSTTQMKRLLQEAYRVGFLDGAEYQRRELVNMYQHSVAEYTNQIEHHQDQLARALNGAIQQQTSARTADVQSAELHSADPREPEVQSVDLRRGDVDPVLGDPVVRMQGQQG